MLGASMETKSMGTATPLHALRPLRPLTFPRQKKR
jgi:hypothetical protein